MGAAPRSICHLIASNFLGGPEKQILEHGRHLDRARWLPVIGSFRENRGEVAVIEAARALGFPTFLIDTRTPFSVRAVAQLRRALRTHRVDVLVTHGYKADAVGALAARLSGIPQLPYYRGYTAETWKVRRYEGLDRALLRRSSRVLCVSEASRALLSGMGLDSRKITCVHNAVAPPPENVEPRDLRQEFAIPAGAPIVAAAGRLSAEKGHRVLVEALGRIPGGRHHLILFGSGREAEPLAAQARALGLADRVHFGGFRSGLLAYLAGADVVANPSFTEGLPNVVLEALAAGLPVVATDVGGVREIVHPGETGWLVPPADPAALAAALEEATRDRAAAVGRGEAGRALVARAFSFGDQAQRLMGIYDDAVGD